MIETLGIVLHIETNARQTLMERKALLTEQFGEEAYYDEIWAMRYPKTIAPVPNYEPYWRLEWGAHPGSPSEPTEVPLGDKADETKIPAQGV